MARLIPHVAVSFRFGILSILRNNNLFTFIIQLAIFMMFVFGLEISKFCCVTVTVTLPLLLLLRRLLNFARSNMWKRWRMLHNICTTTTANVVDRKCFECIQAVCWMHARSHLEYILLWWIFGIRLFSLLRPLVLSYGIHSCLLNTFGFIVSHCLLFGNIFNFYSIYLRCESM